jgi:hypothetical protein
MAAAKLTESAAMESEASSNQASSRWLVHLIGAAARLRVIAAFVLACVSAGAAAQSRSLRPPSDFSGITDMRARSQALFVEAGKVVGHPRCMNCHPVDRRPTQGDDLHPHLPPMSAGESGHGEKGLDCKSCHHKSNTTTNANAIATIPGNPLWHLAPASMSWQGKSLAEICEQIKDPKLNGGFSLEQVHEHFGKDPLVSWAWDPGAGRKPAPGTQKEVGDLIGAWIDTGAYCPN